VDIAPQCRHHVAAGRTLVEVNDGVVTLKGEASSMTQKDLSTEYARNIEGVREVRNEMTVAAPEETEPTEGQKADEIPGSPPVKTALLNHRPTSSVKTKVERRNAKVSLTGMARNESANSPVTTPVTDMQDVTSLGHQMTGQPVSTK
jgi:osmotically-inducible protein OsmY